MLSDVSTVSFNVSTHSATSLPEDGKDFYLVSKAILINFSALMAQSLAFRGISSEVQDARNF